MKRVRWGDPRFVDESIGSAPSLTARLEQDKYVRRVFGSRSSSTIGRSSLRWMRRCKALKIARPRRRRSKLALAAHGDRAFWQKYAYSADYWVKNGMVDRSRSQARTVRNTVWGLLFIAIVSGCAHDADPARELNSAVASFTVARNQTVGLVTSQAGSSVQSAWLPAFSDSVAAYWKQYNTAVATFSPQTKADLK